MDLWRLQSGKWMMERMRFQNTDLIFVERLSDYAGRFGRPRIMRAVDAGVQGNSGFDDGTVDL